MCREGQMSWLSRQLDEANFILTVCSKGLRYFSSALLLAERPCSCSSPSWPQDGAKVFLQIKSNLYCCVTKKHIMVMECYFFFF